jgi:hypothetical protein
VYAAYVTRGEAVRESAGVVELVVLPAEAEGSMTVADSAEAVAGRGLRADVLSDGEIRTGDRVEALDH